MAYEIQPPAPLQRPLWTQRQPFLQAYVTKIVNQVEYVQAKITENDWEFLAMSYGDAIDASPSNSLIYCDPPYIGLTSTYYDTWDEEKEKGRHDSLMESGCRFMVSSWAHNDYRSNELIGTLWSDCHVSLRRPCLYRQRKAQARGRGAADGTM